MNLHAVPRLGKAIEEDFLRLAGCIILLPANDLSRFDAGWTHCWHTTFTPVKEVIGLR